ncbi:hypothetical protein [Pseudomonas sp. LD120]|uniref:hypothetical protein n=1 Tax=Pseudomonas sp. LD120 TaxID=485751 RepID=UPI00135AAD4E|nr:hypothetical protein [Pseudomonas sp. LD120]KAF0863453.1 hypothetical protein PLD_22620 [Pseudomonas sp. LD120]
MKVGARLSLVAALLALNASAWAAKRVDLDYHVVFLPQSDQAEVRLTLAEGAAVRSLDFDLGKDGDYSAFRADGQWQATANANGQRGVWRPANGKASLSYRVRLSHSIKTGRYDSRSNANWALLRGETLVPSARLDQQDGIELVSRLAFQLPAGWRSVETAWPRIGKQRFRIDNPARLFDRPVGWILAGKLGSRRTRLGGTEVSVVSPLGQGMRRQDVLTLLTFVWPQVQTLFPHQPGKLLIVGAADPMWRGSLAARDSVFLHSRLPLVSERGSSPLLRELVQTLARINDRQRSDWISEGVAEYYAIELLRRAGGISDERYQVLVKRLARDSRSVSSLLGEQVDNATVAKAVLLLQELDREIRLKTRNKRSLDDVLQALMRLERVNTAEFIQISERVLGDSSKVLDTALLH